MQKNLKEKSDWLIIANGEPLSSARLQNLAQGRNIMVLDGAYQSAKQAGLTIDILLGDFDSISSSDLAQAHALSEAIQVIHAPDQNKTDLDKGICYLDENLEPKSILITAGIGRRLQHTLYNLRVLKRCYKTHRSMSLVSELEVIYYLENSEINILGNMGDSIGILGFPKASMSSLGLKYEVQDYALNFEMGNSISNELSGEAAKIKIKGSAVIIHELSMRH